MSKFSGFGGGMGGGGNMQQLMKQAQKMQQDMLEAQEMLSETEVSGVAGGGMVEAVMTCDKKMLKLSIKPEAVDPDDIEMLEDLIIAAINDAGEKADKLKEEKMGAFGGLGL